MRSILLLCFCTILFAGLQGQNNTTPKIYDQLYQLNKYWAYNTIDNPILEERRIIQGHENLIQLHLQLVEEHLSKKDVSQLSIEQQKKRKEGLAILKDYWKAKVFPKNNHHPNQVIPYFIDDFNTACAVGHVLRESGGNELAKRIQKENNYAYIEDMNYPELLGWATEFGFEEMELRWIQPAYGPPCPINDNDILCLPWVQSWIQSVIGNCGGNCNGGDPLVYSVGRAFNGPFEYIYLRTAGGTFDFPCGEVQLYNCNGILIDECTQGLGLWGCTSGSDYFSLTFSEIWNCTQGLPNCGANGPNLTHGTSGNLNPPSGSNTTVSGNITVINNGTQSSSQTSVCMYLSTSAGNTYNYDLTNVSIPSLSPGESYTLPTVSADLCSNSVPPGTYYLGFFIDCIFFVDETDESWNDNTAFFGNNPFTFNGCSIDNDNDGYDNTVDCNDNNPNINPGANEICDGLDNDCDGQTDEGVGNIYYRDNDNDGYGNPNNTTQACSAPNGYVSNDDDCNDNNSNINPGANEICDGLDNDCDGQTDEGVGNTYYRDNDNDGYGNPNNTTQACSAPNGYVSNDDDCNDNNSNVNPGANEICDGLDNDCDGQTDEGVGNTYYRDNDNDGYGNPNNTTQACSAPNGYVSNSSDCNDNNSNVNPGANEICDGLDNDCDGQTDEGVGNTYYRDNDNDGYGNPNNTTQACSAPNGYVSNSNDCNDNNSNVNPGANEICDGLDNDCDGQTDEGVGNTYYRDNDNDGYGNPNNTTQACSAPNGYVSNGSDCNDNNSNVNPGANEVCDGLDNDCDGQTDEGVGNTYYRDNDNDGYGNPNNTTIACSAPNGYVSNSNDCNDNNSNVNPDAFDACDGVDNDCDGQVDENGNTTYYRDNDNDGYGNPNNTIEDCSAPNGYVSNSNDCNDNNSSINPDATEIPDNGIDENCDGVDGTAGPVDADNDGFNADNDCDDNNPNINPDATEICDGLDNDCDGQTDEGVGNTYYRDNDNDGYGNPNNTIEDCSAPNGYVSNSNDCNDNNSNINPDATEIPDNGIDENCDGVDGSGGPVDADNDGFNADNDCDDNNPNINPDATEICDGLDNDCDGQTDEGVSNTYYRDNDNDGYGNPNNTIEDCSLPSGYVSNSNDCNDNNANINPDATEIPDNGIDENCDGVDGPGGLTDLDNDGYISPVDCDDNNADINPGATEIPGNNIDENCDGLDALPNPNELTFFAESRSGTAGTVVSVPIKVLNFNQVRGFQFTLAIPDAAIATIIEVVPTNALIGLNTFSIDPQTQTVAWDDATLSSVTLDDNTVIMNVEIELIGDPDQCTILTFQNTPTEIFALTDIDVLPVTLSGELCIQSFFAMTGIVTNEEDEPINEVLVSCTGAEDYITDETGTFSFPELAAGGSFEITPVKNINPKNGVNVADIVKIRQHILGSETLDSPYKIIAADANNSGGVNVSDIVNIRQLILGAIMEFPNNTSWRFVPKNYFFEDEQHPLNEAFEESLSIDVLSDDVIDADFVAIKTADVNNSSNVTMLTSETGLNLIMEDQFFSTGQEVLVPIRAKDFETTSGLQFELLFDPAALEYSGFSGGALSGFDANHIGTYTLEEGKLPIVWYDEALQDGGLQFEPGEVLFTLKFKAKVSKQLSAVLDISEAEKLSSNHQGAERALSMSYVTLTEVDDSKFKQGTQLISISPNPFDENCVLTLSCDQTLEGQLTILAVTGQQIWQKNLVFEKGQNQVTIQGSLLPANGVFIYMLQTEDEAFTGKVVYAGK